MIIRFLLFFSDTSPTHQCIDPRAWTMISQLRANAANIHSPIFKLHLLWPRHVLCGDGIKHIVKIQIFCKAKAHGSSLFTSRLGHCIPIIIQTLSKGKDGIAFVNMFMWSCSPCWFYVELHSPASAKHKFTF